MSNDNSAPSGDDYAARLLAFVQTDDPVKKLPGPLEPPKVRRGPKEKLVKRKLGAFFKAIAEINSGNKKRSSYSSIAAELKKMQEYCDLSERHLRRQVSDSLDIIGDLLSTCPPSRWEEVFGILPPPSKAKRLLIEKTLEFLRHRLSQNK